jgi:DNA-binding transcriptional LysR family regulator
MQLSDRIGRRMKLHDLHVLMAVVQAGSMRKAAAQLNTTQPSISRSIAELEDAVGMRLLDRLPQGVEPTVYGRALLNGGAAMFDDLRQAVKNIEFLADPEAGEVRILSGYHHAPNIVSAIVDRLSQRYPRIVFHVTCADSTDVMQQELYARKVDLLIARRWGSTSDERLKFEFLFDDSYFVVAGAQHPLARRRRVGPAALASASWVLPPWESPPGALVREAFRASGLDDPHVTIFAILPEVRRRLLATGRFLTIFPTSVLTTFTERSDVKVLPVKLRLAQVPIGIVTLKNRTLSPVAKLFIEHAREVAKPLATQVL